MKIQEFDFTVDLLKAILWQYNEAVNLQSILESKSEWYQENQTQFWQDWYDNIFNLMTANEFGLTIWSIILDIPIIVQLTPSDPGIKPWGFGVNNENFENGNFFTSDSTFLILGLEQARTVLRMRYFQITSRGTVPEINKFLNILFGADGGAYVIDHGNMTASYAFLFPIPAKLRFILENYDILPRPAGVEVDYTFIEPEAGTAFIGSGIGINFDKNI